MSKITKKIPIDDMWNIGKSESWFSDMAAVGLHLRSFSRIFVKFEKGDPATTKYRIDILYKKPSQEQLNVYHEFGWSFVANTGVFYIFSTPEDSDTTELHTDLTEQSFTLDFLKKILKRNIIVFSVATILMAAMIFAIYFFKDEPTLYIAEGHFIQQMFLIIVYLYLSYSTIRNYIYVRRVKNLLINGIPINHEENWKKGRFLNGFINTVILTVSLITIIIPIMQIVKSEEYTLPEIKNDLPIIRLTDIEQKPDLKHQIKYNDEDIDIMNNVRYEWSPLAPIMHDIYEQGIIKGMMWSDGSGEYSPTVSTKYYKLTFKKMTEGVLSDLMHRHLYDPRYKREKINNTNFDQLYVAEKDTLKLIFASWDNNVIYIRYHGNEGIDHIINLLTELRLQTFY